MIQIKTNPEIAEVIGNLFASLFIQVNKECFGLEGSTVFFLSDKFERLIGVDLFKNRVLVDEKDESTVIELIVQTFANAKAQVEKLLEHAEKQVLAMLPYISMTEHN